MDEEARALIDVAQRKLTRTSDPLTLIRVYRRLAAAAREAADEQAARAAAAGASYTEIGAALGTSRQLAQRRFSQYRDGARG